MPRSFLFLLLPLLGLLTALAPAAQKPPAPPAPTVVVAEGEQFTSSDTKGWKVTQQDDSYGSHTYGGMWMTHGGCLSAPADSKDAVASQTVTIPVKGKYRVWSKYQAPPYFNYLHQIEIAQKGKVVFSSTYGKSGTPRLWSFSGVSDELWWYWGVDHDTAEAPRQLVDLEAGPAEIRLRTVANPEPAGDRCVDFVLLTTNPEDTYIGFKPYQVGSPFANEALAATKLYFRFKNSGKVPAQLTVSRAGHFQPNYGGATEKFPEKPVATGAWSEWVNIGPFCRLVHDEGLTLTLPGAGGIAVQFARDAAGKDIVGDMIVASGEVVNVPIDITWRKDSRVQPSRELAAQILEASKKWRKANGGKKPEKVLFYGAFGTDDYVSKLKDGLGYNTLLPEGYTQVKRAFVAQHYGSPAAIKALSDNTKGEAREKLRVVSFGDEISLGAINYADPKLQEKFRTWLKTKGVTAEDLKMPPEKASLTADANSRLAWYSNLFNEEERFAAYREMTELAKSLFGPQVLTGANYSPHHLALNYGPIFQWVDIFKAKGMSMFWAEDYVFSIPEVPQIHSWSLAQTRCAVKYHKQPIHFYIMPHAPGQVAENLRRNLLLAVGCGTVHVDNFWVAPEERFTENYVAWRYMDTFRTITEGIYDTAEAERYQTGGSVRPARVAVITGKATDYNESKVMVKKEKDPFLKRCQNAPPEVNQILCRKDQQYLYLALKNAGHAVDLITEDDIAEGALKGYGVVYFAGEWIDSRAVKALEGWLKDGGTLYAAAGLGHLNQYNEADPALLRLLGLKSAPLTKNAVAPRTLLELPLLEPIDTLTLDGKKIPAVGMKQTLEADSAKVLGTWSDGKTAVTVNKVGKGQAFAVGTLAGATWMKSGLRKIPYARGGRKVVYNPTDFSAEASELVRLGVDAGKPVKDVDCSVPGVEGVLIDNKEGTLLTLVNWTNGPLKGLEVSVRLPAKPKEARSVTGQKVVPVKYADGVAKFTLDVAEGDFVLLPK